MCSGFAALVHALRAVGHCRAFVDFDAAARKHRETILTPMTNLAWRQVTLPVRMGGLGIREAAPHAVVAFYSAARAAEHIADKLTTLALTPDDLRLQQKFHPGLPSCTQTTDLMAAFDDAPVIRMQHRLSSSIEAHLKEQLMHDPDLSMEQRIRIRCCESKGCGMYLTLPPEVAQELWLDSSAFRLSVRLRLGLPIAAAPALCWRCNDTVADTLGIHSLACLRGTGRGHAHNAIRDALFVLTSRALLTPHRESMCFANSQQRMDLVLTSGFQGIAQLIDVALTSPLRPDVRKLAATEGPDAVATAYTEKKWREYGPLIIPNAQRFTPLVYDTFGGVSANSRQLLSTMATEYGKRTPEGIRFGRLQFFARLNRTVIGEVAKLVYRESG